jgi:hypothetical protein
MKMFVITKRDLLRLFKYVGIYLVGLSVGAFTGLLPLLAPIAGLPIVLAERQLGQRAAQIVALLSLAATWLLMDQLSFVYVALGLMVGFSLCVVRSHVPFRFVLLQSTVAGFIWVLVMNFVTQLASGQGLLVTFNSQLQQAISLTVERMQGLELYTAEQISEFQQYGEQMLKIFSEQWAYVLFIYLLISILATYLLTRGAGSTSLNREDLLATKAPVGLAIATALLAGVHYLLPNVAVALVSNLWNVAALLTSLSGFLLLFYYLRFLRVNVILRVLLAAYLVFSPLAWRIMLLIGGFDAVFDYRFYARNRTPGESGSNG